MKKTFEAQKRPSSDFYFPRMYPNGITLCVGKARWMFPHLVQKPGAYEHIKITLNTTRQRKKGEKKVVLLGISRGAERAMIGGHNLDLLYDTVKFVRKEFPGQNTFYVTIQQVDKKDCLTFADF